ncbi:MAG: PQQ-binding-like beta-propeller repeat protein [Fimbriimonadales bacterium]|nr:PQQ-binding-like beta-propeller repeat protein [Fimbriimonadales bacterium]
MKSFSEGKSIVCGALLLVAAAACAASAASDWNRFRGPNGDGISPETGIRKDWSTNPPRLLWKASLTDNGYAGPAVAQGIVYIVDHRGSDDIVRAFELRTGRELWRYTYPDAPNDNYGFARTTPLVASGKVYVYSRLGRLLCLDAKSGKLLWQRDLIGEFRAPRPSWDMAASPIMHQGRLLVCVGGRNAAVVALDPNTGRTLWQGGGSDASGYATPVVANLQGRQQVLVFSSKALIGVDLADGRTLWRQPWETPYDVNAATPLVIGNSVFITSGYNRGCALVDVTPQGPRIRWESKAVKAHFSSPILHNGVVYANSDPGELVCLNPSDGRVLWKARGFEKGGLCAVDGVLLAMDGAGGDLVMVAMDPRSYREIGRFRPLGGQSWTAPIVSNGCLVVRNRSTIAVFALK